MTVRKQNLMANHAARARKMRQLAAEKTKVTPDAVAAVLSLLAPPAPAKELPYDRLLRHLNEDRTRGEAQ